MEVDEAGGENQVQKARPYQVELFDKARKANSIVFLGTGSGKTFIAAMLIKEYADELRHSNSMKKAIFLVNTVALVTQQADFFTLNTSLNVRSFCGSDNVDNWTDKEWGEEIDKHQVLVLVHDVFHDLLLRGIFSFDRVSLLIIDEIHHTRKNHPYMQVMNHYRYFKEHTKTRPEELPRILGLTACIVTQQCDKANFLKLKEDLENATNCNVITTENISNLLLYVTSPREEFKEYTSNALDQYPRLRSFIDNGKVKIERLHDQQITKRGIEYEAGSVQLKATLEEDKKKVNKVTKLLANLETSLDQLGIYGMHCLVKYYSEDLLEAKKELAEGTFMEDIFKSAQDTADSICYEVSRIMSHVPIGDRLMEFSSHKVLMLLEVLDEAHCSNKTAPTALIFVTMRQTAGVLAYILKQAALYRKSELGHLTVDYAVGQTTRHLLKKSAMDPTKLNIVREENRKLNETLQNFRSGKVNCLISTSVLEEGMDVKTCNLVVRFDDIPDFRSYVQSKGRARAKPSKFIIMVSLEDATQVHRKIATFQDIEHTSIGNIHNLDVDDESMDEELIEKYLTKPEDRARSPMITSLSAISLLNRYVQSIPTDRFTHLSPYYEYVTEGCGDGPSARDRLLGGITACVEGFKCILHMPHLTPIREPVVGPKYSSCILAKRAVALQACKYLHKVGEITDNLRFKSAEIEDDLDGLDEDSDEDNQHPAAGTKKRRVYYAKKVPEELCSSDGTGIFYAYKLDLILKDAITEEQNVKQKKIYHPEKQQRKLAILFKQKLPDVALRPFHLYMYSGTVQVHLEFLPQVTQVPIDLVSAFHEVVFKDILKLVKPWMKMDQCSKEPLICPVIGQKLDMKLLSALVSGGFEETRRGFHAEDYDDAVVIPLHRDMERCFVNEVLHSHHPRSLMPQNKTLTFQEFFRVKYHKDISDFDQPLLRVSSADKQHDCFQPVNPTTRSHNISTESEEQFLARQWILIPELVKLHKIPASLWQECQLVPFILNHMTKILNVDSIRHQVTEYTGNIFCHEGKEVPCDFSLKPVQNLFERLLQRPEEQQVIQGDGPGIAELVRPLTAAGANLAYDLEQEEILGDSFLKFACSVFVFFTRGEVLDEGRLTTLRSRIVGNKNLKKLAERRKLQLAATPVKFVPQRNFRPPRFGQPPLFEENLFKWEKDHGISVFGLFDDTDIMELLDSKLTVEFCERVKERKQREQHSVLLKPSSFEPRDHVLISDKTLADCVEALIGSFLRVGGQAMALKFMAFLGIDLSKTSPEEKPMFSKWFKPSANAFHSWVDPTNIKEKCDHLLAKIDVFTIEQTLGYNFREKSFLLQALTHCTYIQNKITNSLERIEFLGDAIIDYLVTCYIFSEYGTCLTPGEVTNLRSALVNNNTLAKIAVDTRIYTELQHCSPAVLAKIDAYAAYESQELMQTSRVSSDIVLDNLELHSEEGCPVLEDVEVPKVLGDVVESLMGAIYLDSGMDLFVVWNAFRKIFPDMDDVIRCKPKNHVVQVYERFPGEGCVVFSKGIRKSNTSDKTVVTLQVKNKDEVFNFKGMGNNKKRAKCAAATCAIRELKKRHLWRIQ